ncbi:MAG: AmmeMemoRadiSam system radical SAM enzyme [Candidatus Hydrogenedentes bacterium]|nr:AmmeMemoRadiSam system radical SAM enzyme [Candidatus Hydrogenedentota bacterium]
MAVQCDLCPKRCVIEPGQSGECRIRVNVADRLVAVTYGYPCAIHVDPIEKKPLYHFLPGTPILSIATAGCNLHCKNCQNWEISQANPEDTKAYYLPPEKLLQAAREYECRSIAYTYTEPNVYYEYALDSCIRARECGLKNVLVTAGYINPEPMERLYRRVDAANIDLKAFSEAFYRDVCGATLAPVLDTLVRAKTLGVWVEVTNLVIPTLNDSDAELTALCRWVVENMGRDTPLHFSQFYPQHQMRHLPATPADTLDRARAIALAESLHYVYIGNIRRPDSATTHCPGCDAVVIERVGYEVARNRLRGGKCPECDARVHGVWQ